MRDLLFYVLLIVHTAWILGFQILGLAWLPPKYWYIYSIACLAVGIHWVFNDNKCFLSVLENQSKSPDERNHNDDTHYYNMVEKLTGIPMNSQKIFQYIFMMISFTLVGYQYRKDWKMILITILCFYTHRWSLWSKL